jgi:hypothetical protein
MKTLQTLARERSTESLSPDMGFASPGFDI